MSGKKTKKRRDAEDILLEQVAKYLDRKDWKVVVIGGISVQKPIASSKFNYEFVVRFTGGKKTSAIVHIAKDSKDG